MYALSAVTAVLKKLRLAQALCFAAAVNKRRGQIGPNNPGFFHAGEAAADLFGKMLSGWQKQSLKIGEGAEVAAWL